LGGCGLHPRVSCTALQPLNLLIEYDPSIVDGSIQIICPQTVLHFYVQSVLLPRVERVLIRCVAMVTVRRQICLMDGGLG
jgi:hypothetical protein